MILTHDQPENVLTSIFIKIGKKVDIRVLRNGIIWIIYIAFFRVKRYDLVHF